MIVAKAVSLIWKKTFTILVLSTFSFSQNVITFERITNEQGLSQNSIIRILQDSRGFLWFCTFDGLNRYDGYQFKIFRNIPTDSTSLSNNKVLSICEDKEGAIWIGTYGGGLNKYDRKKEMFKRFQYRSSNPDGLSSNIVTSIIQDKYGYIWVGTFGGGLNRIDPVDENFIQYKHDNKNKKSISSNNIISVFENAKGELWVGTLDGLNKFDKHNATFEVFNWNPDNFSSISSNKISSIMEDKSGRLWIGTFDGGLNMFHQPSDSPSTSDYNQKINFYHFKHDLYNTKSISTNGIFTIYQDRWDDIWVGTDGGGLNKLNQNPQTLAIKNFRKVDHQFIHYQHDPNDKLSISDDRVWSILEDKSGVLWIGTNAGLNKIDIQKKQFASFSYDPLNPGSLSDGDVSSIFEDNKGNLWVGTGSGGLNFYDTNEKQFIKYKHDPNNPNSLSNDEVLSIFQDKAGNLWIGTYDGLNKLNSNYFTGTSNRKSSPVFVRFKHDPENPNSLSDNRIYAILEDRSGNLWVGTVDGGLNRLVKDSSYKNETSSYIFKHYKHIPDDPNSISADRIFSIYEDKKGTLWIGTWGGGLNKLELGNHPNDSQTKFIHFKNDPDDPNTLSDNGVLSIYEDRNGILWVGTYGGGLNKFDRKTETFSQYTETNGLSNNVVLGIAEDDKGNLWLSTIMKLNKFNPFDETFSHFQTSDGLPGNEFSLGICKGIGGEMYFGGTEGFIKFYPDSIKDLYRTSPIIITDFKIFNHSVPIGFDSLNNREVLSQSIIETEQIDLNYDDNVISFEFASINFHAPEKLSYFYKMEGFDKEWNQTDASRRFANYTNLDPGSYTFKVRTNNNGSSDVNTSAIRIFIHPPWWRSVWAYLFYVVFFIGSLLTLYTLKIRRIRLKHEIEMSRFEAKKLHEIDEMKSNFFANISHEFRTPLTLILGPIKELINAENDRDKQDELKIVHRNADMLYGLVNQLMDLSKLESGKMTLKTIETDIVIIIRGLVQSFSSLAVMKNISLKFDSGKDKIISYFDVDKVEKIIINILSNAFKFTKEGKNININVQELNGNVEIKISDEGIGIPKDRLDNIFDRFYQVDGSHTREHEGTGIGLALTKELVELHKGKIEVESEEGRGSTFMVILPLGKHHFTPEEIHDEQNKRDQEENLHSNIQILENENQKNDSFDLSILLDTDKQLILIVEDNSDVRNYIKGHLENYYRTLMAVNGEEGLNTAYEHIPDLIISDVMMPGMDGFKLCERLKTDQRTSHIPIILLTAKATGEDKIEGLETGADEYMMKPFDSRELQVRVKNLLEQRKKLVEHYKSKQLFDISDFNTTSADKKFLNKAFEVIKNQISNDDLNVDVFASEMALSRVQLHRKLVALVGHSPGDFIRIVRLTKASELIRNNFGNISEIALEVGFNNPANFAKAFRAQFGISPTEFKNKLEK